MRTAFADRVCDVTGLNNFWLNGIDENIGCKNGLLVYVAETENAGREIDITRDMIYSDPKNNGSYIISDSVWKKTPQCFQCLNNSKLQQYLECKRRLINKSVFWNGNRCVDNATAKQKKKPPLTCVSRRETTIGRACCNIRDAVFIPDNAKYPDGAGRCICPTGSRFVIDKDGRGFCMLTGDGECVDVLVDWLKKRLETADSDVADLISRVLSECEGETPNFNNINAYIAVILERDMLQIANLKIMQTWSNNTLDNNVDDIKNVDEKDVVAETEITTDMVKTAPDIPNESFMDEKKQR